MAAVLTFSEERNGTIKKIVCDWLSHTDGAGAASTTYPYDGQLLSVLFVPDSGGTAPDNLHSITITDGTNDLLFGQGSGLSSTNSIAIHNNLGQVTNDKLTVTVAGAGSGKGGLVYITLR